MNCTMKSTVTFGKVGYTDAEITAADGLPRLAVSGKDKGMLHQVVAVMNPEYTDVAWVVVDLTGFYRGESKALLETGTFATIELEEDTDGDISWGGSFCCGPTSYETALACAIDRARYA